MTWARFLPLRFIISRAARSQGFLDPLELLAKLRSLAQPSEVGEPIELLRAGVVFHARGLINSKVIQHNLDWVWPYWVERQYNPYDTSFMPRAFSVSHINLSHRNWTAIGYPDIDELPLVDPRGLLTPFYDGWSLDAWVVGDDGSRLLPSQAVSAQQNFLLEGNPAVVTTTEEDGLTLRSHATVVMENRIPVCRLELQVSSAKNATLMVSLRPQNPEGISFIHQVRLSEDSQSWKINESHHVYFDQPVERHRLSDYHDGDVLLHWNTSSSKPEADCDAGLMTAAAGYRLNAGATRTVRVSIPLEKPTSKNQASFKDQQNQDDDLWQQLRAQTSNLQCPDSRYQFLYDAAVTSLILHSPADVYPGPYTYKRFWFRDAAFILHAMLNIGLTERSERAIKRFTLRQTPLGFFRSQEGEWDSNGEVLWILNRFRRLTGRWPDGDWRKPIKKAARWIMRKRLDSLPASPHAGLLPPGFSAEHLGPNDYYYWDNFWSIAGLDAADELLREVDDHYDGAFREASIDLTDAVESSLLTCEERLGRPAMPASPYRRLDAGAIGSLAVSYPLSLCAADDRRARDSIDFQLENCFVKGAFFQDMIHSGLNAYLTLHIAQILLRAGDRRFFELVDCVAELASPTGQWPEAIHPTTGGGCMGDGHHVWAAAEWVLLVRNSFVREEEGALVLGSGIPPNWLEQTTPIHFGPTPTDFGPVTITIQRQPDGDIEMHCQAQWRKQAPLCRVELPGFVRSELDPGQEKIRLTPETTAGERT